MGTWIEQVHKRAMVFQDQIVAARHTEVSHGIELGDTIAFLQQKLRDLYEEEMPLAKIYDNSDLVFHAEGPSAATDMPGLHAFNWLCGAAEKHIKNLAKSIFEVSDYDARRLSRKLDLRFSGFAPGSIYAGFSLSSFPGFLDSDEPEIIYSTLRDAIRQLPAIPEFIDDENVSQGITELLPDPALRDASLEAIFGLAPTGRAGIHTIDISSPTENNAALTNKERVVLRDALLKPISASKRFGRFVGEVREIDLDTGRFHLRNIEGIGTIRCVMKEVTKEEGQKLLGNSVIVEGDYESDRNGKPRLMFAEKVKESGSPFQQKQLDI